MSRWEKYLGWEMKGGKMVKEERGVKWKREKYESNERRKR